LWIWRASAITAPMRNAPARRIPNFVSKKRDAEAKPQRSDKKHLVALEFGDVIEKPRHADEPNHEDYREEDGELDDLNPDLTGMKRSRPRKTREQRQEDDGENVSMTRIPKMISAKDSRDLPSSASAFTMMVVEEMESMAPRKTLSIVLQPNARPTSYQARS